MRKGYPDEQVLRSARTFDDYLSEFQKGYRDHSAVYVSVPITSGRRLFVALREHGGQLRYDGPSLPNEVQTKEITAPNIAAARAAIRSRKWGAPIIDPTNVHVKGAAQLEYRAFWREVLTTKVDRVVPLLDWSYSFGCLYEIRFALTHGLPICYDSGAILTRDDIGLAIQSADADLRLMGFSDEPLQQFWQHCK